MKIPPRHLFLCQVYGTALGSITNYSLIKGVIAAKRPYLDGTLIDPSAQWTGRRVEIFYSASVIFGLVSPSRFFVGEYRSLYWVSIFSLVFLESRSYLFTSTGIPPRRSATLCTMVPLPKKRESILETNLSSSSFAWRKLHSFPSDLARRLIKLYYAEHRSSSDTNERSDPRLPRFFPQSILRLAIST